MRETQPPRYPVLANTLCLAVLLSLFFCMKAEERRLVGSQFSLWAIDDVQTGLDYFHPYLFSKTVNPQMSRSTANPLQIHAT